MNQFLKIIILIIFSVPLLQCQNPSNDAELKALYYPTANKYATILRAPNAELSGKSISPIVSHCRIYGSAELEWNFEIAQNDKYDLVLNYSALEGGANIQINSSGQSLTHDLEITEGMAIKFPYWKLNMERKLLGQIDLTKGSNTLKLLLNAPDENFETNIHILELVPSSKKIAIANDLKRIKSMQPEMDWFSKMNYGAMFHWTSETMPRKGDPKPYQEAVDDFDVKSFVSMVKDMGLDYIIFTGSHAQPHFPAPLKHWEKEFPGMTTERDLIKEIADACSEKNIKFILYLSTHIYAKLNTADLEEFERLNNDLISEIGNHYKQKIDAFWLDGWYQSHEKFPTFDYEKFYTTSKVGNPNRLLSLNTWNYTINSPWQDFWAGEIFTEGIAQKQSICQTGPAKGLQFHHLVVLQTDEGWVHTKKDTEIAPPSFTLDRLINYIASCEDIGPVTLNMSVYQDGTVGEEALTLMKEVKAHFDKNTENE